MVTDEAPFRTAARPMVPFPSPPPARQISCIHRNGQSGGCRQRLLSVSRLTQTRKIFRDDPDVQHRSVLHMALGGKTADTLNDPTREASMTANSRRRICSGPLGPKCCSPLTSGATSSAGLLLSGCY
jgi:hypothetical protein